MRTNTITPARTLMIRLYSSVRLRLRRAVSQLNMRIDSQPMPGHHRLGAWERIIKDETK